MTDSSHTIWRSAKRFFSGTLLSRISGMLRDMAMAYVFGTHASIASFMVAFRLSHLCRRLFGEGALQAAFIPEFEALRHESQERAYLFFRDLFVSLSAFLLLLVLFASASLGALLIGDFFSPANQEIAFLTLLMLPSLLFICLFGLNASLLQCEKTYFIPAVAPVAFNFAWIGAVWLLHSFHPSDAMPLLALGVILACFLQWFLTVPKAFMLLKQGLSFPIWRHLHLLSPDVWRLGKPLLLGMTGVAASQINVALDSLFARYADAEGPALLWYAIRLQQLPLALFSVAISSALLPPLTRAIKAQDWVRYRSFLNEAFFHTFTLMIPLTILLLTMGDTIVSLIFGHGDFSNTSIKGTTECLWAYALGLLPTSLVLLLAPACYAQSNYLFPALASCLTMGLNGLLNGIFIYYLGWGAMSVALATSLSAWINLAFLWRHLSKKNGPLVSSHAWYNLFKLGLIASFSGLGTIAIRESFHSSLFALFFAPFPSFSHQLIDQLAALSYQMLAFFSCFIASAFLLRFPPFSSSPSLGPTRPL